jgi:hypothetical protein
LAHGMCTILFYAKLGFLGLGLIDAPMARSGATGKPPANAITLFCILQQLNPETPSKTLLVALSLKFRHNE